MSKKAIPSYLFINGDFDYREAINYTGTNFVNPPVTVTIDSVKYILPFGERDVKSITFQYGKCYLIGENDGLEYISFVEIDLKSMVVLTLYVDHNQINDKESIFYRIFRRVTKTQIKKFLQYMSY